MTKKSRRAVEQSPVCDPSQMNVLATTHSRQARAKVEDKIPAFATYEFGSEKAQSSVTSNSPANKADCPRARPKYLPVEEAGVGASGGVIEHEGDELAEAAEVHLGPREEEGGQLLREELEDALQVAAQLEHDGALALLQLRYLGETQEEGTE